MTAAAILILSTLLIAVGVRYRQRVDELDAAVRQEQEDHERTREAYAALEKHCDETEADGVAAWQRVWNAEASLQLVLADTDALGSGVS